MKTTGIALLALGVSVVVGRPTAPAADTGDAALAYLACSQQSNGWPNAPLAGAEPDMLWPARGLAAAPTIFSDDFNDGDISDWTVTETDAVFEVSSDEYVSGPYSVHMQSLADGKAMGVSPSYDLELSRKYLVSFYFLVPHANNHWFEVFNNHHIYVVIDQNTDLRGYKPSFRAVCPIATLDVDEWYLVEIKANPAADTYDVHLDGEFKTTCSMWVHSGWETDFRIGDRADGSGDKGEAYWDDFVITQGPLGDLDYDGQVDVDDYAIFAGAMSGPDQPIVPPGDPAADLDQDEDADLRDFAQFQTAFTG